MKVFRHRRPLNHDEPCAEQLASACERARERFPNALSVKATGWYEGGPVVTVRLEGGRAQEIRA